jgi:hypothetical protein
MESPLKPLESHYAPNDDLPLTGFAVLLAGYLAALGITGATGKAKGVRLPERFTPYDLVVGSIAAHKISRTIAKASVTSPLRAPFTEFEGPAGAAELNERVTGTGLKKAVGELITCPFCVGQWVSTALAVGLVVKPRQTRFIASIFAMKTGADFLQLGHAALYGTSRKGSSLPTQ